MPETLSVTFPEFVISPELESVDNFEINYKVTGCDFATISDASVPEISLEPNISTLAGDCTVLLTGYIKGRSEVEVTESFIVTVINEEA